MALSDCKASLVSGDGSWSKRGTSELTDQIPVSELPPDEYLTLKEEKIELFRKVHVLDETAKEIM